MRSIRFVLPLFAAALAVATLQAQQPHLLVVEKGQQTLAIVDPASGKVLASVLEGGITGHEVTASADGKLAFVPIYGNSGVGRPGTDGRSLAVIDIASQKLINMVDFGHGVRPHCALIGPTDGRLYVTTELNESITILDPKTLKIVDHIPTGQPESHMLALSHDGKRAYTANVGPGTVSVIDIQAHKVLRIIQVSTNTQRIAISPDDHWVFTADQTKPELVMIDTSTNAVAWRRPLEGIAYGTAPTPDGRFLLITLPDQDKIAVFDIKAMQVVRSVTVGKYPQEVLVTPDGKTAYVSCEHSNQVAEINLENWTLTRLIATGKATDGLAWAAGQ